MLIPSEDTFKNEDLSVSFDNANWNSIDPDKSDYAFVHEQSGSILLISSTCKKYEASSYTQLTSTLLSGLDELAFEDATEVKIFGRKGNRVEANASLDGVQTYFLILTLRKNRCLYDYALITATKQYRKQLKGDFDALINSSKLP